MSPNSRILVVDDDPDLRELISGFLGSHGYVVRTAADAMAMQQELDRDPPDLVVLDVMMPGKTGCRPCEGWPPRVARR